MTTFDERERAFEAKFARDEEVAFRIHARRNRLLGYWAADLMKLTKEEADTYATSVVHADIEEGGDDDMVRKLLGDLTAANVECDEALVRRAIDERTIEARRQLLASE